MNNGEKKKIACSFISVTCHVLIFSLKIILTYALACSLCHTIHSKIFHCVHKTSLTQPLLIEVSEPRHENDRSCMC